MAIYCGVDFHARQQIIAWCNTVDGEIRYLKLSHAELQKVRAFYAGLPSQVIVGLEASGYSAWFEEMLFELKHEVRIGHATEIRKRARSRQKTDRRDAETILDLLLKDEFPRIYRPSPESRAVLQKLRYRHRLVQLRTKGRNQLHALALWGGLVDES
jgi:transposase